MDFAKSIFENAGRMPLVCAHRGSSAGNIPCNTLANMGFDIIQTDWSGLLKNYLRSRSKAESVGR